MAQKRLRSDSVASTPSTWTIFAPSSAPDADGDIVPTNPHDTKHSRSSSHSAAPAITCFLPPSCAGTAFTTHELFESHYVQAHTNRCIECGRNFPSGRFLELHIGEWHDPLNELRRERGEKVYGCFVEGCDRFCSAPQKRKRHVIDKHHFPKEYNWGIVQWGIDNRTTLLTRPPRASPAVGPTTPTKPKRLGGKNPSPKQKDPNGRKRQVDIKEVDEALAPASVPDGDGEQGKGEEVVKEQEQVAKGEARGGEKMQPVKEIDMVDIEGAMSGLKLVPMSVRFGRRKGGR